MKVTIESCYLEVFMNHAPSIENLPNAFLESMLEVVEECATCQHEHRLRVVEKESLFNRR